MKKHRFTKVKLMFLLTTTLAITSCETEFENPNAATDTEVFTTREGIFAVAIGMQEVYSTNGVRYIVETPAITAREGGITTTYQNMIDLEDGGNIPNDNSNITGLWTTMLSVMGVAEDIVENANTLELDAGTQSGLIAYAKLYHAMCIGALAQNFEQVIVATSEDNPPFVDRIEGYNTAVALLEEAISVIETDAISDEFESNILRGEIDLENTLYAMLARYNLYAGNYDAAITAASAVDQSSSSVFSYDSNNLNPIWNRVYYNDTPNFKPRDNFGLPDSFVFEEGDGRLDFYLIDLDEENINQLPIENLAGFFDNDAESIPVYLPDEMNLIIAEANLRKTSPDTDAAIDALDLVLTDTDDIFGVNANVSPYSGDTDIDTILDEIYKNRRAELFLTGNSLEDSRRFGRPEPTPTSGNYTEERNRNYYPYPVTERDNNTNTPDDPTI